MTLNRAYARKILLDQERLRRLAMVRACADIQSKAQAERNLAKIEMVISPWRYDKYGNLTREVSRLR